ncbi:MAG: carbon-nitrogen hydrolase family protein [Gaiellaceae bacterium]
MADLLRVACVQMTSRADKAVNLEQAERLVTRAAATGADVIALPEKWNAIGSVEELHAAAEPLEGGESVAAMAGWARTHGITLVGGSISEKRDGREKLSNTSLAFGPDGELLAIYRKIHLFDVEVGGFVYRESEAEEPGSEPVVVRAPVGGRWGRVSRDREVSRSALVSSRADPGGAGGHALLEEEGVTRGKHGFRRGNEAEPSDQDEAWPIGLTVCYDVRFPELYRILALEGAELVTVPAHFTTPTGKDHWHVLLRARAIENQYYVAAPAQVGETLTGKPAYGRSLIVDPWGIVLAQAPDEETVITAELDRLRLRDVREKLPSLKNRQADAYRWPASA